MPGFYEIDLFDEDDGRTPIVKWLEDLDDWKYAAATAALTHVLAARGKDVCGTEWGKNLGQGLYELRIRHTAAEIRHMFGDDGGDEPKRKVLLRIFFHPYGPARIVVLSGYDKGASPGERAQQRQIERARSYLKQFKQRPRNR